MKCIVCDRCKAIIENPRRCRVITCARPVKPRTSCDKGGKVPYRGNDPQQNDLLWEKEVCDKCLDELEAFFEAGEGINPHPPEPTEPDPDIPTDPDNPDESGGGENGGENPPDIGDGGGDDSGDGKNPDGGEDGEAGDGEPQL